MSAFAVRPAAPGEYEAVAGLTVAVYAEALGSQLSDAYRDHLADVAARAKSATVLVAVSAFGRVLGSVTYVPDPESRYAEFTSEDEAGIRMLAVGVNFRRRGVGRALVVACLDQARAAGKERVALHTTPSMLAGQALYESLGFRRAPERDWVPEPGVALIGYTLELAGA